MKIKNITIKDIDLDLLEVNNELFYIYNNNNGRMIQSNVPPKTYLDDKNNSNKNQEIINNFLFSKYSKGKLYNFHFLRINISMDKMEKILNLIAFFSKKYISFLLIIINIFIIFTNNSILVPDIKDLFSNGISTIIFFYIGSFIITLIHEMGHFAIYNYYFKSKNFTFGLLVRYYSLLLFYTTTPFLNSLENKQKRKIILGGVQIQQVISILLFILFYLTNSHLILLLYLQNLGTIAINLIPFLKFDGYWLVSSYLGVDDYMKYFWEMLNKRYNFNIIIFILGCLNIICISILVIIAIKGISHLFF